MINVEIYSQYNNELDFDALNASSKEDSIYYDEFLQHSNLGSPIVTFITVKLPEEIATSVACDALKYIFQKLHGLLNKGKFYFKVTFDGKSASIESSDPITEEMKNKLIDEVTNNL